MFYLPMARFDLVGQWNYKWVLEYGILDFFFFDAKMIPLSQNTKRVMWKRKLTEPMFYMPYRTIRLLCPACKEETSIIEDIHLTHPEIEIEAFADGFSEAELKDFIFPVRQDNGVSQYLKINTYPTILVFNEKKERYRLSGYVDKDKILRLFR